MESKHDQILLIDDDPFIHDAIKMILEPEGFRVTCCLTGPMGLAAMKRDRPQLVLLDIMLATPTEGFHLAYAMKDDPDLKDIPIIALSAVEQTFRMNLPKDAGTDYLPVDRFFEKPFDAASLRDAVHQILNRHEAPL